MYEKKPGEIVQKSSEKAENHPIQARKILQYLDFLVSCLPHQGGDGIPLVITNFKEKSTALIQKGSAERGEPAVKIQSVRTAVQGHCRLSLDLLLEPGEFPPGNVRGVGGNETVLSLGHFRGQGKNVSCDCRHIAGSI